MNIQDIVNVVINNGASIVILAYFIYKDNKFNEKLLLLCDRVNSLIEYIEQKKEWLCGTNWIENSKNNWVWS